jgi:hypothetical protein
LIQHKKRGAGSPPLVVLNRYGFGLEVNREVETREGVEDAVQSLAPLGQRDQVALVHLGEGVVQGPEVARGKLLMRGLLPLVENVGNHRLANRASAIAAQDEGASLVIGEGRLLVLGNAGLLLVPHIGERANSTRNDLRQVAQHVGRVATSEHNLIVENEIGADERSIASAEASREALVMRVAETHNRARGTSLAHVDLEKTEVTLTETGSGVQFLLDRETRKLHLLAENRDEIRVRDRLISLGSVGGRNLGEIGKADLGIVCAADMEVYALHFFIWLRLTKRSLERFGQSSRTFLLNFRGKLGSGDIGLVGSFVEPLLERLMVLDLDTRNLVIESDAGQSAAHRTVHDRIIVIHESSLQGGIAFANFFLRSAEFFFEKKA